VDKAREALQRVMDIIGDPRIALHGLTHSDIDAFNAARAALAAPAWVPVAERLPETSGEYLCRSNLGLAVHRFAPGMRVWSEHFGEEITHWMPLPAAPEPPPTGE
jgi:hypothetical protein